MIHGHLIELILVWVGCLLFVSFLFFILKHYVPGLKLFCKTGTYRCWCLLVPFFLSVCITIVIKKDIVFDWATGFATSNPSLKELDPGKEKVSDKFLVLIHGWKSNGDYSWKEMSRLISSDPRFNCMRLIEINYPVYQYRQDNLPLKELVNEIINNFNVKQLKGEAYLIGHSLGGVIAREMLIHSKKKTNSDIKFNYALMLGAPFRGPRKIRIWNFEINTFNVFNQPYLDDLGRTAPFRREMEKEWKEIRNIYPNAELDHCFYSKRDSWVGPESATSGCYGKTPFLQGFEHTQLQKPENKNDDRYSLLMSLLGKRFTCNLKKRQH